MSDIYIPIDNPKPVAAKLKVRARSISIVNNLITPKQVIVQVESFPVTQDGVPVDLPRDVIGQFAFDPVAEAAKDSRIGQALGLIEAVITERLIAWKATFDAQQAANKLPALN